MKAMLQAEKEAETKTPAVRRQPDTVAPEQQRAGLAGSIHTLQRTLGNNAVRRLIQPRLMVGAAHDPLEQEADRVADQVLGQGEVKPASIQPARNADDQLQTRQNGADGFATDSHFENRLNHTRGGGSPLPSATRDFMEPRFGMDFSGVHLHTGSEAAQLNREIDAQAFTCGQDIYLGAGCTDLQSSAGRHLLAHELTHVIQQGSLSTAGAVQRKPAQTTSVPHTADSHQPVKYPPYRLADPTPAAPAKTTTAAAAPKSTHDILAQAELQNAQQGGITVAFYVTDLKVTGSAVEGASEFKQQGRQFAQDHLAIGVQGSTLKAGTDAAMELTTSLPTLLANLYAALKTEQAKNQEAATARPPIRIKTLAIFTHGWERNLKAHVVDKSVVKKRFVRERFIKELDGEPAKGAKPHYTERMIEGAKLKGEYSRERMIDETEPKVAHEYLKEVLVGDKEDVEGEYIRGTASEISGDQPRVKGHETKSVYSGFVDAIAEHISDGGQIILYACRTAGLTVEGSDVKIVKGKKVKVPPVQVASPFAAGLAKDVEKKTQALRDEEAKSRHQVEAKVGITVWGHIDTGHVTANSRLVELLGSSTATDTRIQVADFMAGTALELVIARTLTVKDPEQYSTIRNALFGRLYSSALEQMKATFSVAENQTGETDPRNVFNREIPFLGLHRIMRDLTTPWLGKDAASPVTNVSTLAVSHEVQALILKALNAIRPKFVAVLNNLQAQVRHLAPSGSVR